jgi:lipoprotein signal peptidase
MNYEALTFALAYSLISIGVCIWCIQDYIKMRKNNKNIRR